MGTGGGLRASAQEAGRRDGAALVGASQGNGGGIFLRRGYYGGYYGGYHWWGGGYNGGGYCCATTIRTGADPPRNQGGSSADEGASPEDRRARPRYVDGYVGVVDDFDGIFQLHIDSGPHRIEVHAPGYETLTFDVRITPDHSTTYQGEMKKLP